eukprot:SAG22_NODE_158_length_16966_cov_26.252446_10_plen_558_part_00
MGAALSTRSPAARVLTVAIAAAAAIAAYRVYGCNLKQLPPQIDLQPAVRLAATAAGEPAGTAPGNAGGAAGEVPMVPAPAPVPSSGGSTPTGSEKSGGWAAVEAPDSPESASAVLVDRSPTEVPRSAHEEHLQLVAVWVQLMQKTKNIAAAFDAIDESDDGLIKHDELVAGLGKIGVAATPLQAWLLLDKLDTDHSGSVDRDQFVDYFESLSGGNGIHRRRGEPRRLPHETDRQLTVVATKWLQHAEVLRATREVWQNPLWSPEDVVEAVDAAVLAGAEFDDDPVAALQAELERQAEAKLAETPPAAAGAEPEAEATGKQDEEEEAVGAVVEQTAVLMLRKLFDAIDANGNGVLSRAEFEAALRETVSTGRGQAEKTKLSSRAKQLRLTLTRACDGLEVDDEHLFDILDGDNSGTGTLSEAEAGVLAGGQGGITFSEFKQMRANYALHGHVHSHILDGVLNKEHGAIPRGTIVKHAAHGKGKVHDHAKGGLFKDHKHTLVFDKQSTAGFSPAAASPEVLNFKSSELKSLVLCQPPKLQLVSVPAVEVDRILAKKMER